MTIPALAAGLTALVAVCSAETLRFDRLKPGSGVPKGWTISMTHEGEPPRWELVEDPAPAGAAGSSTRRVVFAQTSNGKTSGRFPLAVYNKARIRDGSISAKFKPVSGERDQAAGLVWRFTDPDNYYIVRANALEDNVVLYKVEKGTRIALEPVGTPSRTYGVKQKVPKGEWSELRVDFSADLFQVFFNGTRIMEVRDATFPRAGAIGLWTKADSVIYFDQFQFRKGR
jgi:hypothetical protein